MNTKYLGNSHYAAHVIAATERHNKDIAAARQFHLLRENSPAPPASTSLVRSIRRTVGDFLVRIGALIQGKGLPRAEVLSHQNL